MSTIVSVKKIKLKSEVSVYDIEVPKNHNFVLESGVVVHNSKDESDSLAGAYWDALQYKDDYLYWNQSDVDYEGVNETMTTEDKIIEDMKKDILPRHVVKNIEEHKNKDYTDFVYNPRTDSNILLF